MKQYLPWLQVTKVSKVLATDIYFDGSTKADGRELKSCSGQVFNFKLGHFCYECMVNSRVEPLVGLHSNVRLQAFPENVRLGWK